MTVLIVGPDEVVAQSAAPSSLHVAPKEGRQAVATALARLGCNACTLDGKPSVDGETRIRRFLRILDQNDVRKILVLWPNGTALRELDVELAHLLTRIVEGKVAPDDIIILAESDCEPLDHDEGEPVLAYDDEGTRALYYQDLVDEGVQVRRWFDLETLGYVISSIASEERKDAKTRSVADVVTMINPKLPADGAEVTDQDPA